MFFWNVEPAPFRSPVAQFAAALGLLLDALLVLPPCESLPQADSAIVPAAASTRSRAPGFVLNGFPSIRRCRLAADLVTDGRKPRWTNGAA
jgi:hypothetical protein